MADDYIPETVDSGPDSANSGPDSGERHVSDIATAYYGGEINALEAATRLYYAGVLTDLSDVLDPDATAAMRIMASADVYI